MAIDIVINYYVCRHCVIILTFLLLMTSLLLLFCCLLLLCTACVQVVTTGPSAVKGVKDSSRGPSGEDLKYIFCIVEGKKINTYLKPVCTLRKGRDQFLVQNCLQNNPRNVGAF